MNASLSRRLALGTALAGSAALAADLIPAERRWYRAGGYDVSIENA